MQPEPEVEEPILLSVRVTLRPETSRRKRMTSAPPPPMGRRRNWLTMTVFGALWVTIGVASVAYVAQRGRDNIATSDAR